MIYELIITQKAVLEISKAYFYYEAEKPGLGEQFLDDLDIYFKRITASPEQFPQKKKPYREAYIKKFPYLIVFEIRNDSIIIYSVFNTWQNPQKKI